MTTNHDQHAKEIVDRSDEDGDVDWSEYIYHNGTTSTTTVSSNSKSSSKDKNGILNSLFEQDDEPDEFECKYCNVPTIVLQGESHRGMTRILKSTGLAIWEGGQRLCEFLAAHPELVQDKRVLELGSGTGLCSILAYHLSANQVIASDGDSVALQNLRENIKLNCCQQFTTTTIQSCQLIWGQNVSIFVKKHGHHDVILASDCVYMNKCVEPLWDTVDQILVHGHDGLFIYVNHCISQAPLEDVMSVGKKYGFVRIMDFTEIGINDKSYSDVCIFRRK